MMYALKGVASFIKLTRKFPSKLSERRLFDSETQWLTEVTLLNRAIFGPSGGVNCCWSSPAQSFLVPSSEWLVTTFYSLTTLRVMQLCNHSFFEKLTAAYILRNPLRFIEPESLSLFPQKPALTRWHKRKICGVWFLLPQVLRLWSWGMWRCIVR
jgi:hypothetical protein